MSKILRPAVEVTKLRGFFSSPRHQLAVRQLSASTAPYEVRIVPELTKESKVILPISMTRYDGDKDKRSLYDKELGALFKFTAEELEAGRIGKVEILSTAGLQEINWEKEKSQEIENHFLNVHCAVLQKQTKVHAWSEFIETLGKEKFENNYSLIQKASTEGSHWYELMLKAQKTMKLSSDLSKSLEYQRREYAAILSMKGVYTNLAYLGNISLAWSHLYQEYAGLPAFSRISIEKSPRKIKTVSTQTDIAFSLALHNLESLLSNKNLSKKEKEKFGDMATSLLQAYLPKDGPTDDQQDALGKKLTGSW